MNQAKKMPEKQTQGKNPLSEKILDINGIIINRGSVLLEVIEKNPDSKLIIPDTVDRGDYVYYKVIKTGNNDFAKTHPDFKDEGITQPGNIIINIKNVQAPLLTCNDKKYIVVHEASIDAQVKADNFKL